MHFHLFYVKIKGIMDPNVDPIIGKRGRLHIFAWFQFKPHSTRLYSSVLDTSLINQSLYGDQAVPILSPSNTRVLSHLHKTKLSGEVPIFKSSKIIICPIRTEKEKIKFSIAAAMLFLMVLLINS